MSEQTNYCTTKGIGWMMLIVIFLLVGVPLLMTYAMIGSEDYARQCKMTPMVPCFGLGE